MSFFSTGAHSDVLQNLRTTPLRNPEGDGAQVEFKTKTRTYRLMLEREDAMNLYADLERDLGLVRHGPMM